MDWIWQDNIVTQNKMRYYYLSITSAQLNIVKSLEPILDKQQFDIYHKTFLMFVTPTTPTGIRIWVDCALTVASQRSNQFVQRVGHTSEGLAGQLDSHIPPFLNCTKHPCLATRHSHQDRNMTISRLWVNYQCTGLYPGLQANPQCNVPALTIPPTGIWTWVDSALGFVSQHCKRFGQRVRPTSERLAGKLECHLFLVKTMLPLLFWIIIPLTGFYPMEIFHLTTRNTRNLVMLCRGRTAWKCHFWYIFIFFTQRSWGFVH